MVKFIKKIKILNLCERNNMGSGIKQKLTEIKNR